MEKTARPCNVVIFGGEGDLAFRKLYPALYSLDKEGRLSDCTKVIGFGRGKYQSDQFLIKMREWTENSDYVVSVDDATWQQFEKRIVHFSGDATSAKDQKRLVDSLDNQETVYYLSTPPSIFGAICDALKEAKVVTDSTRLVVEKPLGTSLESFDEINKSLFSTFTEQQIYRIDHYLGKETVQNLIALRFANIFFEPIWNRNYIDHVQITVAESGGVESRWSYYNEAGALRDMVQNHLLQLLCLVSMEFPARNQADDIRDEKLKVLRSLQAIDSRNVRQNTVRGQYIAGSLNKSLVPGYSEEQDASGEPSNTETYVAIKAHIDNNRWQGVPFYLRTGKRMSVRHSEIVIKFKSLAFNFIDVDPADLENNSLVIRLQPNEGIQMNLMHKVPGLASATNLQNVGLDLSFEDAFENHRSPSAYERLLLDVIRGDQTLFMRSDELRAAWRWVDGILEGWNQQGINVKPYKAGSSGPDDALALLLKEGKQWKTLEY